MDNKQIIQIMKDIEQDINIANIIDTLDNENDITDLLIFLCESNIEKSTKFILNYISNNQYKIKIDTICQSAFRYSNINIIKHIILYIQQYAPDISINIYDYFKLSLKNSNEVIIYIFKSYNKQILNDCCKYKNYNMIKYLLQHIDISKQDLNYILQCTCIYGNTNILIYLLNYYASSNIIIDKQDFIYLFVNSFEHSYFDIVKYLIIYCEINTHFYNLEYLDLIV